VSTAPLYQWARDPDDPDDMLLPTIGNGADAIETDPATCAQIKFGSVLKFVLGEWAFDTSLGFPWPQQVWGQKTPDLVSLRHTFQRYILATPPAVAIADSQIAFDREARVGKYAFQVTITSGQTVSVPS